jgi:hypothetical protein
VVPVAELLEVVTGETTVVVLEPSVSAVAATPPPAPPNTMAPTIASAVRRLRERGALGWDGPGDAGGGGTGGGDMGGGDMGGAIGEVGGP